MAVQGSIAYGRVPSAPDLEEGNEEVDTYEALSSQLGSLAREMFHSEKSDFTWINPQGAKEVNLNNPYVAAVWNLAERIERFRGEIPKNESVDSLKTKMITLQRLIYEATPKPSDRYFQRVEECNAFCDKLGVPICCCIAAIGMMVLIVLASVR